MPEPRDAQRMGLPTKPFLYTLDQVADLLSMKLPTLKNGYMYFHGVNVGVSPRDKIAARNINPQGNKPEWRVSERELIRWLKYMGFRVYDSATVR